MACYHPLKAFITGTHKNSSGRLVNDVIIESFDTEFVRDKYNRVHRNFVVVPCGKCIGCRLEYSRQWANRCLLEMQDHESSYFLTLTYDDEHIPTKSFSRLDGSGETDVTVHSLDKRDVQLFMKRLRKVYDGKLRYLFAGEYGGTTMRPHYHGIVFGLKLDDLHFYKLSKKGFKMFTSPLLDSVWKKGYVVVEECTWETCAYTARYVTKKLNGTCADIYDYMNISPEFVLMSRRPGIGRNYLDNHFEDLKQFDDISVSTPTGGVTFGKPRYFNRVISDLDPDFGEVRSQHVRSLAEDQRKIKELMMSQSYLDGLASEEVNVKAKTSSLTRL